LSDDDDDDDDDDDGIGRGMKPRNPGEDNRFMG
jgi:hypothetical protein